MHLLTGREKHALARTEVLIPHEELSCNAKKARAPCLGRKHCTMQSPSVPLTKPATATRHTSAKKEKKRKGKPEGRVSFTLTLAFSMFLYVLLFLAIAAFVWVVLRWGPSSPFWLGGAPRVAGDALIPFVGSGLAFTFNPGKLFSRGYAVGHAFSFTRFGTVWTAISQPKDLEHYFRKPVFDFSEGYQHLLDSFWPKIFPFIDRQASFSHVLGKTEVQSRILELFSQNLVKNDPFRKRSGTKWPLFQEIYELAFRTHAEAFIGPRLTDRFAEFHDAYFRANPESVMFSYHDMVRLMASGIDRPFGILIEMIAKILDEEISAAGGVDSYISESDGNLMCHFFSYFLKHGLPEGSVGSIRSNTACVVWAVLMASIVNTASAASWVLFYVSRDKDLTRRLRSETDDCFGAGSQPESWRFDTQAMSRLTFVRSCISEALRMGQFGLFLRMATEDYELPSGVVVKKGSMVSYYTSRYYFDEGVASDDPSRFNPDRKVDTGHWGIVYWGRGLHPCMGMRIAQADIAFIVCYMFATYDIVVSGEPVRNEAQMGNIAVPKNQHEILVETTIRK